MVFLNYLLVGGLAAIGAPIVIHLLHRTRVVPMEWGAMMFLEELMAERRRRIKLREWLLLLIRAALVGCLALALMRPLLQSAAGVRRAPGEHTSAVLVLDDSYSMNAGRAKTAWQQARELALRYVESLRKGDDATVLFSSTAGQGPPPAALFDLERVREIIRKAEVHHAKSDLPRALTVALQRLESRHNPRRELVLFSDMQAAGWNLKDGARWSFLKGAVETSTIRPRIVLASVASSRPDNLALLGISASRAVIDSYTPVTFHATLANEGPEAVENASVTFIVDGAPKATRSVSLPAAGREVLSFEHRFERPGSHYVACKLRSGQDALRDDNILIHSVVVFERLPVLLVDGERREQPFQSETDFLKAALAPSDEDDPTWRTVIEPTVVDVTDLRYRDFSKFRVVVLANVAALPGAVVSDLERFVVAGGGLLITLGDHVRAAAYNRDFYRQGSGLLPVALARRVGAPAAALSGPAGALRLAAGGSARRTAPVHLANLVSGVPALQMFGPKQRADWSRARIRTYFATRAPAGREARTVASFSDGGAALLQKRLGEGKVTLFTSAVDTGWSDLPVHPFYVPLMQNLVLDLASAIIPPRNLEVGQPLSYVATGPAALRPHQLFPPRGAPLPLKMQRQGALSVFTRDARLSPGLYVVAPEPAEPEERVYYSVTADRRESLMARLKSSDFERLERDLGARHAANWKELARFVGLDSGGYEISPYLILAAIALCFVEIYLTRRWA